MSYKYGHDVVAEALHSSDADEWCGDMDGYGVTYSLYLCHEAEVISTFGDGTATVEVPAGTYLILTNLESGRVHAQYFDTAERAQEAYDAAESHYGDWLAGREHDEYRITSSTGRIGA